MGFTPVTAKGLRRRHRLITVLFTLFSLAFVLWFLVGWRIGEVEITGCSRIREADIRRASGIEAGRHLYAVDTKKLSASLSRLDPYIKSVDIGRHIPKRLTIAVTEHEAVCRAVCGEKLLLLSPDLTVLETLPLASTPWDVPLVVLPEIKEASVGKALLFSDDKAEEKTIRSLAAFLGASFAKDLVELDLTDRFSLFAKLKNGIVLSCGTDENLKNKLLAAAEPLCYLEEKMPQTEGVLYITEECQVSFLPDVSAGE